MPSEKEEVESVQTYEKNQKEFEKYNFASQEQFDAFKKEFGNMWGLMLLMIDPVTYGKIITTNYGIKQPMWVTQQLNGGAR